MEDLRSELRSPKSESLCKVCGDKASGKHYGVASCDGCRGFFKRSIRRNLEYVCKENGRCIVDVTRRNQCQSCRFKKCLHVNMKRDAVQHERAPRASQNHFHYPLSFGTRFRNLPPSSLFNTLPLHLQGAPPLLDPLLTNSNFTNHYFNQNFLQSAILPSAYQNKPQNNMVPLNSLIQSHIINSKYSSAILNNNDANLAEKTLKEDEVTSSEETSKEILEENITLSESKRPTEISTSEKIYGAIRPVNISSLTFFPLENIYESATKLLFLSVKWARSIPSFLQLSYRDQLILLEESWSELFVLTAAQWSLPIDEGILLGNISSPNRHNSINEDVRKLREIITRLSLLRPDHTEHACMKALVLFKAECRGLMEPTHVELLQDQTHVMLHEYCIQRQHQIHKGRFGKLLLTLPAVQSVSKRSLQELLFKHTVGDISIEKMLSEMTKVCS